MEELLAQVIKIQQQQLLELQKQYQNLIEIIRKETENSPSSFTPEAVANAISEFTYNSDMELLLLLILEDTSKFSEKDAATGKTRKKNKTFVEKAPIEHEKYCNCCRKKTGEICFRETLSILTKIFSEKNSLFNTR